MDERPVETREFDDLFRLYELYTDIQLRAETLYYNRSNFVLVAESLFLLAFQKTIEVKALALAGLVAMLGIWMSLLWLALEQRQLIHHQSREFAVLRPLESELLRLAELTGRGFRPSWIKTEPWIRDNARWYQRFGLRRLLRGYMPATFAAAWLLMTGYVVFRWVVGVNR